MATFSSCFIRCGLLSAALVFSAAPFAWAASPDHSRKTDDAASFLVHDALGEELAGRNDQRKVLLKQALQESPDDPTAHWHLGEVRGEAFGWQKIADAEADAKKDARLAEYRRRRDAAGATLDEQIELARWCQKNKLVVEERLHWCFVLQMQPNHSEAFKRLGLRRCDGMLLTGEQVVAWKEHKQNIAQSSENMRQSVAQWRRALDEGESSPPAAMRAKIVAIADPSEIAALERAIYQEAGSNKKKLHELTLAAVKSLRDSPHPAAAECLVKTALLTDKEELRKESIDSLKRRPKDHYVPLLLAALETPLDADVRFAVDGHGNLISSVNLHREGMLADYSYTYLQSPAPAPIMAPNHGNLLPQKPYTRHFGDDRDIPGNFAPWLKYETPVQIATQKAFPAIVDRWQKNELSRYSHLQQKLDKERGTPTRDGFRMKAEVQRNLLRSQWIALYKAARFHEAIENRNEEIEKSNAFVTELLTQTTGKDLGELPSDWWKWWWNEYNATDAVVDARNGEKPVVESGSVDRYRGYHPTPSPDVPIRPFESTPPPTVVAITSCFAPGTPVWTQTGRQAIEKIRVGDRVLAQDPDTGELAYKTVLAVTQRPPHERLKFHVGEDMLEATPGHPFWVNGKGWMLAKQLEAGDSLHTVSGSTKVESIEPMPADPTSAGYSYNLVVADFNSYFVGEQGIFVHDNMPRRPTSALVPGLLAEVSAENEVATAK